MKNSLKKLYIKSLLFTVVFITTVAALGDTGVIHPW